MEDGQLQALHEKILTIVKDFDQFGSENGIVYYLMGGSALGAIRHGGFIPWDDDLDVFMDRANYIRFLAMARINLDTDQYYLQEENSDEWSLFLVRLE